MSVVRPSTDGPASSTEEVVYKGQRFVGLESVWDECLGTNRYRSRQGSSPPGSVGFAPLMHGMGPVTSHAGSMLATLNTLTASKKHPGRSESGKALRQLPHHRLLGGEAIDLPGAHARDVPSELLSLEGSAAWVAAWIKPLAARAQGPIVPIARSASAALVLEVHRCYPGLLDGVVLLSPMVPSDAEHSNEDLLRRVGESQCELNQPGFAYMNRLAQESRWDEQPDPFGKLPTLVLTGSRDTQVSDRVRGLCAAWDDQLPHVESYDLPQAGHDVFNLRDRASGLMAFGRFFQFLNQLG